MAVNITEIGTVYDALETKVNDTLTTMFESYNITAEGKAQVLSNAIATMLQLSVSSTQQQETITKDIDIKERQMDIAEANSVKDLLFKEAQTEAIDSEKVIKEAQSAKDLETKQSSIELQSAQKLSIDSEKAIKEAQSAKDLLFKDSQKLILDQQKLTEIQRTSQLVQSISESTEKQAYNVANTQKQGILLDGQASKLTADTALVGAQEDAITQQVIDNRKIKVFDTLGETYGTVGAGGLTVSADMWSNFFTLGADLAAMTGFTVPSSTTVSKVV